VEAVVAHYICYIFIHFVIIIFCRRESPKFAIIVKRALIAAIFGIYSTFLSSHANRRHLEVVIILYVFVNVRKSSSCELFR